MKKRLAAFFCMTLFLAGCGTWLLVDVKDRPIPPGPHGWEALKSEPGLARRIVNLDPENITSRDIRSTLSRGPTPWLMAVAPLAPWSEEFLNLIDFFLKMGYPSGRIGDPRIPDYRVDWLEKPRVVAGMSAWLYERDGMAPILVGWSGGGILVIHVLHTLNGSKQTERVVMVNARTGNAGDRGWYRDPYTGQKMPIKRLRIPFAAVLATGGLGRAVQPDVWPIVHGMHLVPDNAVEFLGFKSPNDMFGTDEVGAQDDVFLPANTFRPMGTAKVRSIMADDTYHHFEVVHCNDLLTPEGKRWVQGYRPEGGYGLRDYRKDKRFTLVEGKRNLWCGELWYGIKKAWALSAQRVARAFLAGKRLKQPPGAE